MHTLNEKRMQQMNCCTARWAWEDRHTSVYLSKYLYIEGATWLAHFPASQRRHTSGDGTHKLTEFRPTWFLSVSLLLLPKTTRLHPVSVHFTRLNAKKPMKKKEERKKEKLWMSYSKGAALVCPGALGRSRRNYLTAACTQLHERVLTTCAQLSLRWK